MLLRGLFQDAGVSTAPRTKGINALCSAHLPFPTCLLPLVREILCDGGESLWTLIGMGPSACSEEGQSLLSHKGSVGCKGNFSSSFLSRNLLERTNQHPPRTEDAPRRTRFREAGTQSWRAWGEVQIRTSVARGNKDVRLPS